MVDIQYTMIYMHIYNQNYNGEVWEFENDDFNPKYYF